MCYRGVVILYDFFMTFLHVVILQESVNTDDLWSKLDGHVKIIWLLRTWSRKKYSIDKNTEINLKENDSF